MNKIKYLYFCVIVTIFLSVSSLAAQQPEGEELFKVKIPTGFIYKDFHISPGEIKALFFLSSQPGSLDYNRTMVILFDPDNLVIKEKVLDPGWIFGGFTTANHLILLKGEGDSLSESRIIDLQGRELLSIKDIGSRRLINDLYGREIAVVALGYDSHYQPTVVYDLDRNREKFRLGPIPLPGNNKDKRAPWTGSEIFLPVGQNDLFLWGLGATILLQKYSQPGYIWKIDSIGGNISGGKLIGQDYLGVSYFNPDKRYKEGLAIIRLTDGQIVFRIENYIVNGQRENKWPPLNVDYLCLDEDSNLIFLDDSGESAIIDFDRENKTWKKELRAARKLNLGKSISTGKGRLRVIKGYVYYAEEGDGQVVIRRINLSSALAYQK